MPGGGSVGRGELLWRHITAIYKFGIVDFGARSKEPSRLYTSIYHRASCRVVVVGVLLGKTGAAAVSLLLRCGQFGVDFCLHLWTEWQFVNC